MPAQGGPGRFAPGKDRLLFDRQPPGRIVAPLPGPARGAAVQAPAHEIEQPLAELGRPGVAGFVLADAFDQIFGPAGQAFAPGKAPPQGVMPQFVDQDHGLAKIPDRAVDVNVVAAVAKQQKTPAINVVDLGDHEVVAFAGHFHEPVSLFTIASVLIHCMAST